MTKNVALVSKSNGGNVLFLILIVVILFAALSYAVTQGSRQGSGNIESEKESLVVSEINNYLVNLNTGLLRVKMNGCGGSIGEKQDFTPTNLIPVTAQKKCYVFHPDGGGAYWRDLMKLCKTPDKLSYLRVGESCGIVTYIGDSGGKRYYVNRFAFPNVPWSNGLAPSVVTGATSDTDGKSNTDHLVGLSNADSPYIAATLCRSLGSEWYLPSNQEMQILHAVQGNITFLSKIEGLWTSTQHPNPAFSDTSARWVIMTDSVLNLNRRQPKNNAIPVICFRTD